MRSTEMVTKKKRPQSDQGGGTNFETLYDNLRKAVKAANTDKRDRMESIINDIDGILVYVCDPDPPGCNGSIGSGTYAELAAESQQANSKKKTALLAVKNK